MMSAQCHGVTQRGNELLTIGAGSNMPPQLGTNILSQFVVNVGGQLS
jgi:hypothetical protein